jgi:hypothetical protein
MLRSGFPRLGDVKFIVKLDDVELMRPHGNNEVE